MEKQLGIFTFFTGAGFLDLGFEKSDFHSVMANELEPNFCKVYKYAREHMGVPMPEFGLQEYDVGKFLEGGDEAKLLRSSMRNAKQRFDLIGFIGGPPCPDFSVAGKNAGQEGKHGKLSQIYADMIAEYRPDFFVFENVKGLWRTAKHRAFFDAVVQQMQDAGYAVDFRLINSLEYGAPQDRDRIILIGVKMSVMKAKDYDRSLKRLKNFPWEKHLKFTREQIAAIPWPGNEPFVEEEHSSKPLPPGVIEELTCEYWFCKNEVESHPNSHDFFTPRAGLVKMQTFDEGDDSRKCYKRLNRWRYSPTVAYGNNEVHLHPYKARRLSVAEALALQSLPKEYVMPADVPLSFKFKTIGNGVPFLAAKGIAETLKDFLSGV